MHAFDLLYSCQLEYSSSLKKMSHLKLINTMKLEVYKITKANDIKDVAIIIYTYNIRSA